MGTKSLDNEMMRLFEELVIFMERSRRIRRESIVSKLLFEIYSMNRNNISKVFSESATWIKSEFVDPLLEQGLIQRIASEEFEKYALTFKGIAHCIQLEYSKTLEEQFLKFLELSDQKFNTSEQTRLRWDEKLATLSLILMASTSNSSAIRLNNEVNKTVLTEVFDETLDCLKKFGLVESGEKLKTKSRGETPVSALMSRLNMLARKTNHYYTNLTQESGYFFNIEKNEDIDEKRLIFLLKKIFEHYDVNCNYLKMTEELIEISQQYSHRFLARSINPTVSLNILKKLKEFMNTEIWHLSRKPQPNLDARGTSAQQTGNHKIKRIKTSGRAMGNSQELTSWIKE